MACMNLSFTAASSCGDPADLVLKFEDESRGVAETVDGRRRKHQRDSFRIGGELLFGDAVRMVLSCSSSLFLSSHGLSMTMREALLEV